MLENLHCVNKLMVVQKKIMGILCIKDWPHLLGQMSIILSVIIYEILNGYLNNICLLSPWSPGVQYCYKSTQNISHIARNPGSERVLAERLGSCFYIVFTKRTDFGNSRNHEIGFLYKCNVITKYDSRLCSNAVKIPGDLKWPIKSFLGEDGRYLSVNLVSFNT